jgi:hypothetical protein
MKKLLLLIAVLALSINTIQAAEKTQSFLDKAKAKLSDLTTSKEKKAEKANQEMLKKEADKKREKENAFKIFRNYPSTESMSKMLKKYPDDADEIGRIYTSKQRDSLTNYRKSPTAQQYKKLLKLYPNTRVELIKMLKENPNEYKKI